MKTPFIRSAYNYDADQVSKETGLDPNLKEQPSYTQQSHKEECDINEIVRRFGLTGQLPDDYRTPVSGDFTGITDFQSAMNAVRTAEEEFNKLPGAVRERFNNDPQRLIEFVDNDTNMLEAEKLGLLAKKPEKTRDAITAIDDLTKVLTTPKT